MTLARIYLVVLALGFAVPGLIGLVLPDWVAKQYGFQFNSFEGATEIRSLGAMCVVIGVMQWVASRRDRWLAAAIDASALLLLALMAGRVVGLLIDGFEQPTIRAELLIESLMLLPVPYLRRQLAGANPQ
ncbi:DUF4345 family protein [Gammaproteobacteria bacterium]|nr:DUF4345 family protein [Gammaproteobacteria bacterium]